MNLIVGQPFRVASHALYTMRCRACKAPAAEPCPTNHPCLRLPTGRQGRQAMGDLKTQAKDCGYWAFQKESLNLGYI